jgi:hypothetical protein
VLVAETLLGLDKLIQCHYAVAILTWRELMKTSYVSSCKFDNDNLPIGVAVCENDNRRAGRGD